MKSTNFKNTDIGDIPTDWDAGVLSQFISINPQRNLKKGNVNKYIPMANLLPFERKISGYETKAFTGGMKFINSDTLLARITPCLENGKTAYVDILGEGEVGFGSTEYIVLNKKEGLSDSKFVYYLSLSPRFRDIAIKSMVGSSGRQRVQTDKLASSIFGFPKLVEQQQIASILSSLDDKIELNRRMNKTLEEMGKALFNRWFVDFEFPCLPSDYVLGARKPADLEKYCTYKSVGGLPAPQANTWFVYVLLCADNSFYIGVTDDLYYRWYQHKTGKGAKWTKTNEPRKVIHYESFDSQLAAAKREKELKTGFGRKWLKREYQHNRLRQAGEMVESELGEIPKGWTIRALENIADISIGRTPPRLQNEWFSKNLSDMKWISIKDMADVSIYINRTSEYLTRDAVTKFNIPIIPKNTVIVSFKLTVGRVAITTEEMLSNEAIAHIKTGSENISSEFIFFSLKGYDFSSLGTTSSIATAVNSKSIRSIKLVLPAEKILKDFTSIVDPLFSKIYVNVSEINSLSSTRNSLLPRLMSGKLRVN